MTTNPGFNYASGTNTNRNASLGIRYGVIHQNEVSQAWAESSEAFYGKSHCPKCGNEAVDCDTLKAGDKLETYDRAEHEYEDYACVNCEYIFGSDSAFTDEPISHYIDNAEYSAEAGESGDIFVTKSPFFTYAQFCSPCAPGACHLSNPLDEPIEDNKCYCLGHDFFEDGKAPYRVWSVETGLPVEAESYASQAQLSAKGAA